MQARLLTLRIAASGFALAMTGSLSAAEIDLTKHDAYIRRGFNTAWTSAAPGEGWLVVAADSHGARPVRIRETQLVRKRTFLSPVESPDEHFTISIPFELTQTDLAGARNYSLKLAHIGMAWEVYLNGVLQRSQLSVQPDGSVLNKTRRGVVVPLDSRLLQPGKNILALRIAGDSANEDTGLFRAGPYVISDQLETDNQDTLILILISLYFFVGCFHLVLFVRKVRERFNLTFGLLGLCLFAYYYTRTNIVFEHFDNSTLVFRAEVCSLFLIVPLSASFLDSLFRSRLSLFTRLYWGFSIVLMLFALPSPLVFVGDLLRLWQITVVAPLAYCVVSTARELVVRIDEYRQMYGLTTVRALFRALIRSPAGNLLFGAVIVAIAALYEIVDSLTSASGRNVSVYALFLFVAGVTSVLTNRILDTYKRVEILHQDLNDRYQELKRANEELHSTEGKYRQLIEGSVEIIFTLDEDLRLTSINKAAQSLLGYAPSEITGTRFFDLLFQGELESGLAIDLIHKRVHEFVASGRTLAMKAQMLSRYNQEPREFNVRLEKIPVGGGRARILGKASLVLEDSLLKYLVREQQKYVIGNYLTSAEELSQRLVRNVEKYLDAPRVTALRIGLREMLINAIEHGNLAITYDEKTRELTTGDYLEFIQARQSDPMYRDRKVIVEYELTTLHFRCLITDEGSGFNHAQIRKKENIHQTDSHGRGIAVTENAFDEVVYNDSGNAVTLTKHFRRF